MAAEGPGAKATKTNVNLSTADFALAHYVVVTTEGESAGVEQLFAEDFNQKIQATNSQSNSRSAVVKLLKKQKGEKLNCTVSTDILEESADYMVAKVTTLRRQLQSEYVETLFEKNLRSIMQVLSI